MDEIDSYAKRLAARTANRGEHLGHYGRQVDTGLYKRSCNVLATAASVDDYKRGDLSSKSNTKASPPKRQCLSEDKENLTEQRPRGLAALRAGAWSEFETDEKEGQEENFSTKVSAAPKPTTVEEEKPKVKGLAALRSKTSNAHKEQPAAQSGKGWDPKVLASLEAQGFSKTPSASKLTYTFQKDHKDKAPASVPPPPPPPPPPTSSRGPSSPAPKTEVATTSITLAPPKPARAVPRPEAPVATSAVASAAAFIAAKQAAARANSVKQPNHNVIRPSTPDPSTLSVRERRGLFDAPTAKAAPPCPSPAPELMSVSQRKALFEQAAAAHAKDAAKSRFGRPAKRRSTGRRVVLPKPAPVPALENVCESWQDQGSSVNKVQVHESESDLPHSQELALQNQEITHLSENSGPEEEGSYCEEDDSYSECEDEDSGPEEEQGEEEEEEKQQAIVESSLNFSTEDEEEADNGKVMLAPSGVSASRLYPELPPLDDVLGSESSSCSYSVSPVKTSAENKGSGSTSGRPCVPQSVSPEKGQALTHTLSMYRRQQKVTVASSSTPTKVVAPARVQQPQREPVASEEDVHAKIRALQQEAEAQAVVMAQASQALELCRCTPEFMGSTEQVEGERLLLLASQRRHACLREVERLKTLGAFGSPAGPAGGGTLTLGDVQLPLKRHFLAAQLQGKLGGDVHHFVCLIREGGQLRATQLMSTSEESVVSRGSLCFSNHMALRDLAPDFRVSFLVYALQTQRETVPHDQKYHIRKDSAKLKLTPKAKKLNSKQLVSPVVKNTIRTPSFGLVGSLVLTRSNCGHRSFVLDKVPDNSPLEGTLMMQVRLTVDHDYHFKGFLSIFEEVRGFGAWHRRWCVLQGPRINCWSYPEDEGQREPICYLELCEYVNARLASRDECARPNSIALDKRRNGTRHLAADTKEERQLWCTVLADALAALRHWGEGCF